MTIKSDKKMFGRVLNTLKNGILYTRQTSVVVGVDMGEWVVVMRRPKR